MNKIYSIILLVFLSFPLVSICETNIELCANKTFVKCMNIKQNVCHKAQKQAINSCLTKYPFNFTSSAKDDIKIAKKYGECITNEYLTNLYSNMNKFSKCLETSNVIKYYKSK